MNILNNKSEKDNGILLNQIICLGEKHNVSINKSDLCQELEEGTLVISLNNIDKTLHIYSKQNSDLSITIPNTTASNLKSVRPKALLRYSIDSINK